MKIICDERETPLYNKLLELNTPPNPLLTIEKKVLHLGDVVFEGNNGDHVLLFERKTFSDLLASIRDGRYDEQSYRLIHCGEYHPHNIIYLIEGAMSTVRSHNEQNLIYSAIVSLNQFKGFSVMRTNSVTETSQFVMQSAIKMHKDFEKGKVQKYIASKPTAETPTDDGEQQQLVAETPVVSEQDYCSVVRKVKKDNVTPQNIGEIVLCQIPGISSSNAIALMKNYGSFKMFYETIKEKPELLEGLTIETNGKQRKISKTIINNIKTYLF